MDGLLSLIINVTSGCQKKQNPRQPLEMLAKLMRKHDIDTSKDRQIKKMQKPVDKHYLEKKFEREVHNQ